MTEDLPIVTVIIAARPGQSEVQAAKAASLLRYPVDRLEILVARGKQPSVQRNTAMRSARGELLYFLDDDSLPAITNLEHAVSLFRDPKVQLVGGPNLCPPDAPFLEQVFAVALASWLAFGPSRARYAKVGARRSTSEKELILCNLLARREPMVKLGGFNEALYPNEENALMDDLIKSGGKLLYDPEFLVHRRPRPSIKSFCKMLMTYGRGRAEQFRLNPTPGSALNFVPPLFVLYLVLLPLLAVLPGVGLWAFLPILPYGLAVAGQTFASMSQFGVVRSICAMPFLVLTHVLYGAGFWRGLRTKLRSGADRPKIEVSLESIPVKGTGAS